MTKSTYKIEVRPDVNITIPRKLGPFRLMLRRFHQLSLILTSKRFSPSRNIVADTSERYAQETEIKYYEEIAKVGLYPYEDAALQRAIELFNEKSIHHGLKALVIGCGTGREVFVIEKAGFKTTGYDNCHPMIDTARKLKGHFQSDARFTTDKKEVIESGPYDLVVFTYGLSNHFIQYSERVALLKEWSSHISKEGYLLFSGYFRKIHFGDRFFIAWLLLKLRWLFRKSCPFGTTAISHFGWHNDEVTPLPFHFYQTAEEIKGELRAAGLTPIELTAPENYPHPIMLEIFLASKKI